jgi:flagellar motor switch/type III secretory pathway protein FliN
MGGRVNIDDLTTHYPPEDSAPVPAPASESNSCLGPLEPLPRLSHREARLASRLARLGADGGILRSLAWLSEALGTKIEAGPPNVLWRASAKQRGGAVAQFVWTRFATRVGLGIETPLAHGVVDGLLGFDRPAEESRLQISPVEWGVLTMVAAETLRRLSGSAGPLGQWDLLLDRVGPDPFDTSGLGRVITIRWPLRIGAGEGAARLWVSESLAARWLGAEPKPSEFPHADALARFPELSGEWFAKAGVIPLDRGSAMLRVGGFLTLGGTGMSGEPESPKGVVTLALKTSDRDGRFVIPGESEPLSGGGRFRSTGPIHHVLTPREGLPMSPSSSTSGGSPVPDVPLTLVVELGRVNLTLARLAELRPGDVVPLGRHPREPIELTSGGRLVARGELVQVDDELGVRLTTVCL